MTAVGSAHDRASALGALLAWVGLGCVGTLGTGGCATTIPLASVSSTVQAAHASTVETIDPVVDPVVDHGEPALDEDLGVLSLYVEPPDTRVFVPSEPDDIDIAQTYYPELFATWCPLVLAFDGDPIRFEAAAPGARFSTGRGDACDRSDWPAPRTPWLVRDIDANGRIDGAHELLGSGTRLTDGSMAAHGFAALADLDDDGDGWITARDAAWATLALWSDHDRDRLVGPGELRSLDDAGVTALPIDFTRARSCDDRGNCTIERAFFDWTASDGSTRRGVLVDAHLACR
jgi:hypothetical protein